MRLFGPFTFGIFMWIGLGWRAFARYCILMLLCVLDSLVIWTAAIAYYDGWLDSCLKLLAIAGIIAAFGVYVFLGFFRQNQKHLGGRWGRRSYVSRGWCAPPRRS